MKDLVEFVTRSLVTHPDRVQVELFETQRGTQIEVTVDPEDRGAVIGRRGRTIDAIRTLVDIAASHEDRDVRVELLD